MKQTELFQNIDTLMTEVLELKKSWDEKSMEKAEEDPSDAQADAVHMADHGADEESLSEYAKKLSDEELHELISSLVQEAEGRGGDEGEAEAAPEEADSSEEPEMEKAEEEPEAEESESEEGEEEQEPESEEESGDLGSKVAELSDEEIQTLMAAIKAEMSNRGSNADSEDSMEKASKEGVEWHNEGKGGLPTYSEWKRLKAAEKKDEKKSPSSAPAEKSGQEETMEKSLKAALKKIDALSAQIDSLKKSNSKKVERKETMPAQRYADPKVTVLEKSVSEDSKVVMTGATLANWLISEQAAGNKKINSDLVTKANLSKSVEDASEFYKELERIGIKAPRS